MLRILRASNILQIGIPILSLLVSQSGIAQTKSTINAATNIQTNLPSQVEAVLLKNNIAKNSLSVFAIPASATATATATAASANSSVISFQADKMMNPASTMKLLTSFIALDVLGPTFQWKTQFLADEKIQNERLKGNLYLRGGGDPNLTWDKLAVMLRNLRQLGLQKIEGDIVLDRTYFQPNRPELNAPVFDENPDAYYNVIPDALLIHSNITSFSVDSTNKQINTQLLTPMSNISVNNRLTFNNRSCAEWKNDWRSPTVAVNEQNQMTMSFVGSFPKNCQIKEYVNIIERNAYIANMIRTLWTEIGGTWNGKVVDGITPSYATLLTERLSESLLETIRIINKFSDNSMARIVFMTLGAQSSIAKNFADTNQAANAVVRDWFAQHQIKESSLSIENGSGLSRTDRISPRQLASLLKVAHQSNWYPEFASSLPIAAVDGSMKNRLSGSLAHGRARIKTGYLKNALAVAGYVRDTRDQDWIVVAIINTEDNVNASKGKPVLDEILLWLANGALP